METDETLRLELARGFGMNAGGFVSYDTKCKLDAIEKFVDAKIALALGRKGGL